MGGENTLCPFIDCVLQGIIPTVQTCRHKNVPNSFQGEHVSLHAGVPATRNEQRSKAKVILRRWNACMQAMNMFHFKHASGVRIHYVFPTVT